MRETQRAAAESGRRGAASVDGEARAADVGGGRPQNQDNRAIAIGGRRSLHARLELGQVERIASIQGERGDLIPFDQAADRGRVVMHPRCPGSEINWGDGGAFTFSAGLSEAGQTRVIEYQAYDTAGVDTTIGTITINVSLESPPIPSCWRRGRRCTRQTRPSTSPWGTGTTT